MKWTRLLLKKLWCCDSVHAYVVFALEPLRDVGSKEPLSTAIVHCRSVAGPLEQLVSEEHGLARVDRFLDLGRLREVVANWYWADNVRPGIDPEVGGRLMLAGLLAEIVHD